MQFEPCWGINLEESYILCFTVDKKPAFTSVTISQVQARLFPVPYWKKLSWKEILLISCLLGAGSTPRLSSATTDSLLGRPDSATGRFISSIPEMAEWQRFWLVEHWIRFLGQRCLSDKHWCNCIHSTNGRGIYIHTKGETYSRRGINYVVFIIRVES